MEKIIVSKMSMSFNILYNNINGYTKRKHQLYNFVQNENIDCVLLVETKTKTSTITDYKNWKTIKQQGNQITNYPRGGSIVQGAPKLSLKKENPPRINNPLNECIHFSIPFKNDNLHFF